MSNRIIKFRAWDGEFMIKQENLDELNVQELRMGVMCDCPTDGEQTKIIVMQFTGLSDKNGVEIYEGDIIKIGDDIDTEEIRDIRKLAHLDGYIGRGIYVEVIGNIWEDKK